MSAFESIDLARVVGGWGPDPFRNPSQRDMDRFAILQGRQIGQLDLSTMRKRGVWGAAAGLATGVALDLAPLAPRAYHWARHKLGYE